MSSWFYWVTGIRGYYTKPNIYYLKTENKWINYNTISWDTDWLGKEEINSMKNKYNLYNFNLRSSHIIQEGKFNLHFIFENHQDIFDS